MAKDLLYEHQTHKLYEKDITIITLHGHARFGILQEGSDR